MPRVLLDTDVVLDLILDRVPFVEAATQLFELHEEGRIDIFVAAITPINVFYITRKNKGVETARRAVNELLATIAVCPLDHSTLKNAGQLNFRDFEDAVQHESAVATGLDAVITRDVGDYANAKLRVFSPSTFLEHLDLNSA